MATMRLFVVVPKLGGQGQVIGVLDPLPEGAVDQTQIWRNAMYEVLELGTAETDSPTVTPAKAGVQVKGSVT